MSGMISTNNFRGKCFGLFIGLYNRNKILLTITLIIFFASLIIGLFIGYFLTGFTGNFLTNIITGLTRQVVEITTLSIFLHNLQSVFLTYLGGVIGIIPAATIAFNGFIYGAFVGYFMHGGIVSNYFVNNPVDFIIYTLPHGIFEIPGFIIAGTAGFRLTTLVISMLENMNKKTSFNDQYWKLKDSLILLVIALILIFIAAIIETNISLHVGNYITGLNLHGLVSINT